MHLDPDFGVPLYPHSFCSFSEKARLLESVGAKGAIVIDNNKDTSSVNSPLFAMSGDGTDDVSELMRLGVPN